MIEQEFIIGGMSCAACASRVERAVSKLDGACSAQVNLLKNNLLISYDENRLSPQKIADAVSKAGYSAYLKGDEALSSQQGQVSKQKLRLWLSLGLTVLVMIISMGPMVGLTVIESQIISAAAQLLLTAGVIFLQQKYFISGFKAVIHKGPNMDTLVAMGAGAAFLYSCYAALKGEHHLYFESAAAILTLVSVGKYFEAKAKVKTTDLLLKLMDLSPKSARIKRGDEELEVEASQIKAGDLIILRQGNSLAADGEVVEGEGFADESALTGEPMPVKKKEGSTMLSASILKTGYVVVKARAVGEDTTLAKIIKLIDKTSSQKAPIARLADKIAYYFVPGVITIAVITAVAWLMVGAGVERALTFAVAVLVVSCPCALGLATPTAIMAGTGRGAALGILYKSAEALEAMGQCTTVIFDKTGTLTSGKIKLLSASTIDGAPEAVALLMAASVEAQSGHPIAKAVTEAAAQRGLKPLPASGFELAEGIGVSAKVAGEICYVGNLKLFEHLKLEEDAGAKALKEAALQAQKRGQSALFLVRGLKVQALFVLGDALKEEAPAVVSYFKEHKLKTVLLTGDSVEAAMSLKEKLDLYEARGRLLPADKALFIEECKKRGEMVCMIGDGINDAAALTAADAAVGVAGASDIAISSCNIALMRPDFGLCATAHALSAATLRIIKENLFWAFFYNVIAIPVAAGVFYSGWGLSLSPMIAALLMSLSSICVVSNALRLNWIKLSEPQSHQQEHTVMKKVMDVQGMHCNHCTASVSKALSALPGITNVQVSLDDHQAVFDDEGLVDNETLSAVIASLGFECKGIQNA